MEIVNQLIETVKGQMFKNIDRLRHHWPLFVEYLKHIEFKTYLLLTFLTIPLLLVPLFFLFKKKSTSTKNLFMLLGLSNSGKTTLFLNMIKSNRPSAKTYPSIKENIGGLLFEGTTNETKSALVVDIPGNPRIQNKFLTYLPHSRGIVFVVDALDSKLKASEIAEFLYKLFICPQVYNERIPIHIFCNKDEVFSAMNISQIRNLLKKEIDILTKTRAPTLHEEESHDEHNNTDDSEPILLIEPDEHFDFDVLPFELSFSTGSALQSDFHSVTQFMKEHV